MFFLLGGQLHHHPKEPSLRVAKKLHSAMHVIVHGHQCQLWSGAKPVADVQKPCECLEVILMTLDEDFEHLSVVIRAMGRDNVLPFGQADLLKTLFEQQKQCGTIELLVGRQAQNNI
jgi:hypothetical protein